MYDGISGLVTQPFEGAKKEGVVGFIKGFGKGIGGVMLKPSSGKPSYHVIKALNREYCNHISRPADLRYLESLTRPRTLLTLFPAFFGLPAYTFKGIYKELQKHHGATVQNYIIAARTAQGFDEWNHSSQEERVNAVRQWQAIQLELGKEKHQAKHSRVPPPCRFMKTRHMSFDDRKKLAGDRKKSKTDIEPSNPKETDTIATTSEAPLRHAHTYPQPSPQVSEAQEFEEAIQQSIAVTSKGNPEEDAAIEQAIRASVLELQRSSMDGDDEGALHRAIQASVAEADHTKGNRYNAHDSHPTQLEAALHQSIQQRPLFRRRQTEITDLDFDDSGVDTDDDENIKAAIESSKRLPPAEKQDPEFERALAESRKLHEEHTESLSKAKTEEEIVMEYVKKQSLAEAAYRDAAAQKPRQAG